MKTQKKEFDLELAKKLASIQCTQEEISRIVGVSPRTLRRSKEFTEAFHEAREKGKASLRRMQWEQAEKGNPAMLIWLGKQYLDQADKREDTHKGDIGLKLVSHIPRPQIKEVKEEKLLTA